MRKDVIFEYMASAKYIGIGIDIGVGVNVDIGIIWHIVGVQTS